MPSKATRLISAGLLEGFQNPPDEFRPAPFYWWAGEPLDRSRIEWQLDQLKAGGVRQLIISYPHGPDGITEAGSPSLFSTEWWELFRWFLSACRARGMTTGIQDYTIVGPILREIGLTVEGLKGGQMSCVSARAYNHGVIELKAEEASLILGAWAYPLRNGAVISTEVVDLSTFLEGTRLCWKALDGEWLVSLVFVRLGGFNAMHGDSARLAIERLYQPFERECPEEIGKTLKVFFQDELDFGITMPMWSESLRAVFLSFRGYDLWPRLPALWEDLGESTIQVRLDYAETVTSQLEKCYFQPIYEWHQQRGTLFGHDNVGRGEMRRGRDHYGDYFRAMRWYSAPGCDDPKIKGSRAFKGLKVNSSIAHLYGRPRVWIEAFHSSGWGTTPAEVISALNEDFAYGANFVNLHGLYYTTHGGWWEWAPPDFHFRQPYWKHFGSVNDYFTRLSWLLSRGVHRCDVAILYPSASLEAEPAGKHAQGAFAHIGHNAIEDAGVVSLDPEQIAFGLGKYLFERACDFDFVDFESLAKADVQNATLSVAGEEYRVLILPGMNVVRQSSLEMVRKFVRGGGLVIACGCIPSCTDKPEQKDFETRQLPAEIFQSDSVEGGVGRGLLVPESYEEVLRAINKRIVRDVTPSENPLQVLHRSLDGKEIYYLFNPSENTFSANVRFRAIGKVEHWDAWTSSVSPIQVSKVGHGVSEVSLKLQSREARVLVFHTGEPQAEILPKPSSDECVLTTLEGRWKFRLLPTLDNRFGDFQLPAANEWIGPEARRFRWAEETEGEVSWREPSLDDSAWPETTFSFGPRLEFQGPLPPGSRNEELWRPYAFSLRWGIERDPFLTHWLSGPHGLKNHVPDEFLDFHCDTPGHEWRVRTQIVAEKGEEALFYMGGRCAYEAILNDNKILEQSFELPPGLYAPWNIPHYECVPQKVRVKLHAGINQLELRLVQPVGQRTRAFFAFNPPERVSGYLGLRWFNDSQVPRPCLLGSPNRKAVWLRCKAPPGLKGMNFRSRGRARVWADGNELAPVEVGQSVDGVVHYHAELIAGFSHPVMIVFRIEADREFRAGDVLAEPVRFDCGEGDLTVGDWSQQGLGCYSGMGQYQREFQLSEKNPVGRYFLDLGDVGATAEIWLNGRNAGILNAAPCRIDVTEWICVGTNQLKIQIANTLANHYSIGIPTPYAFEYQTRSGLMGPVRLIFKKMC